MSRRDVSSEAVNANLTHGVFQRGAAFWTE